MRWYRWAILALSAVFVSSCGTYGPPPPAVAVSAFPPPPPDPSGGPGSLAAGGQSPLWAELGANSGGAIVSNGTYVPTRGPSIGACDCPYDITADGRQCGANSNYYRSGGQTPSCYGQPTYQAVAAPPAYPSYKPAFLPRIGCAENGSCYGDISALTGRPKTVSVGGYFRSNGTYVRGHYRSRPR